MTGINFLQKLNRAPRPPTPGGGPRRVEWTGRWGVYILRVSELSGPQNPEGYILLVLCPHGALNNARIMDFLIFWAQKIPILCHLTKVLRT